MNVLVHQLLLAAAAGTVWAAAFRLAAWAGAVGLERVLATAAIATALVVIETLALGLAALGASPATLTGAALLTWLTVRRTAPAPATGAGVELVSLLRSSGLGVRMALGALLALALGLVVWGLRHPGLGIDSVTYHLPEALSWIHSGHPGRVVQPSPEFQTGWFPLTNEVVLAWAMAISASFAPVALWAPLMMLLALGAGWLALRRLGAGPLLAALALAALVLSPDFVRELNTAKNDDAALAWLLVGGALALAAVPDRSRLFAVAMLAIGLSVGTKTTTAPLGALVLALGASRMRTWSAVPVLLAAAAAAAAGGLWYARDLLVHGSPFWPEVSTPWGDAVPRYLARVHVSLLQRPGRTLDGRIHTYLALLAGNLVLLVGGMLAATLSRRREVILAAAATAVSIVLWARAPFTGLPDNGVLDVSLTVTRYLLPGVAAGALALALMSRAGARRRLLATLTLAAAAAWSLVRSSRLAFPALPGAATLALALVLGALAGALAPSVLRAPWRGPLALAALASAVAGLAAGASGYVGRVGASGGGAFASPVIAWFAAQPAFGEGSDPISVAPQQIGPLAGDRLRHDVRLIGSSESCRQVRARGHGGWVVVRVLDPRILALLAPSPAQACLAGERPLFEGGGFRVYRSS